MADEVFALSPISARAAQPSEEDYVAIQAAFMETSRGRWFLGEYAKRNRNADTRLVLDAVARIEGSLAAQKEAAAEADLAEALASIRKAVEEAQAAAHAGFEGLALDERLAPIAKGVRIIREISWRWRETGADGRICDILDSQVAAIESSADRITVDEARSAVDGAFAAIEARIDDHWPGRDAPVEARRSAADASDANVVRFPAPAEEAVEPEAEAAPVAEPAAEAPAAEIAAAEVAEALTPELAEPAAAAVAEAAVPVADMVGTIEAIDEAAADAHDEAVLDLIATEMSAPEPIEDDFDVTLTEMASVRHHIGERAPYEAEDVAPSVEAVAPPVAPPAQPAPMPAIARASEPHPSEDRPSEPGPAPTQMGEVEVSVGSAVIASGVLKKPTAAANDPLAPIRRMSQAEKIAFFS